MENMEQEIKPLLADLKNEFVKIYGTRLKGILLYGSFARGDAEEGSDVDIMIILNEIDEPANERERISDILWRLALKYNKVISVIPVAEWDFKNRHKPLFLNARQEGVLI